jgi:hypothetical protein
MTIPEPYFTHLARGIQPRSHHPQNTPTEFPWLE